MDEEIARIMNVAKRSRDSLPGDETAIARRDSDRSVTRRRTRTVEALRVTEVVEEKVH